MFRKLLLLLLFLSFIKTAYSQCTTENWSLEKRTGVASAIVEGKVLSQYPFREPGTGNIYTASVVEVYKIFKGKIASPERIEIITFGGTMGMERHHADPELELSTGDFGVFLLTGLISQLPDPVKNNGIAHFRGVATYQSFIAYDTDNDQAFDQEQTFQGIQTELYETLTGLTGQPAIQIKSNGFNPARLKYRPTASPVITSFGSSSANAGTGDILTVNGQGFGSVRGNGRIEFLDANFGDGRRMKTPYAADYSVWNDTMIKVRIPSRAGTGNIKVATNDSQSFTTMTNFKINFSHLNVSFQPSGGNEQYYPTDHINDNNKGGYTFQMNPRFKANTGMTNALLRAMETWRCGTFMNWIIGNDTNIKVTAADKVNVVRLTKYSDNRLAVCYSYWQGCYTSGTLMEWYVHELDIEADSSRNWYYGTGTPAGSQYDFQSVIAHELGHGHQLGHVISSNEMMHFSISNGQRKANLSNNDLAGGTYVKDKSVKINVCSGGRMIALNSGNCTYTKPLSGFSVDKVTGCTGQTIVFTDTTKGVVKSYLWNFGADATPQTAGTQGPHSVSYSSSGTKTVTLITSNDFGTDTVTRPNYISILPAKPAAPKNLTYSDTACLGLATLSLDTLKGPGSYVWNLPSQATEISGTINSKKVSWTSSGGPYIFNVKVVTQCGSSDSVTGSVVVLSNPVAGFSFSENGRNVTFTNTSQFAKSYKWYFGDGDSSTLANPVHLYPMGKPYSATLKAINQCKTISLAKTVNPFHPAGIDQPEEGQVFYPNPTGRKVYFSPAVQSFSLYDQLGKLLVSGGQGEVDLNFLNAGLYQLVISTRDGAVRHQTLIKK